MKDDEYKGYYCLLIAILCNLNASGSQHNVRIRTRSSALPENTEKEVRKPSIKKLKESEMAAAMKALLDQGYSQDAVSEAFQCFPSTVRRRVRKLTEGRKRMTDQKLICRNI